MRKLFLSFAAAVLLCAGAGSALATGPNVYPDGAEGFWMGAAPPPGFYYVNYDLWYRSHKFTDNHGSEVSVGPMSSFKVNVLANVSRFLWMSDKTFLGGNWGMHMFVPLLDQRVRTGAGGDRASGLGDIIIDPFILAWHKPNLHMVAGIDIYTPTGKYDQGELANLGSGTWVYQPVFAITYITPIKGVTASAKFMYDFSQPNNDWAHPLLPIEGDMKYGQELHMDYWVDYTIDEAWKAGVGGYFHKQITDDRLDGNDINNMREQVFAIGPGIEYTRMPFIVQFRPEFEMWAKNKSEGVSTWLRVTYIPAARK